MPSEKDAVVAFHSLTEPGMRPQSSTQPTPPHHGAIGSSARHISAPRDASKRPESTQRSRRVERDPSGKPSHHGTGGGVSARRSSGHEGEDKRNSHDSRRRKSWLREGLRVRVVSQTLHRGKAYLTKAAIMNVLGQAHCSIKLDSGPVLDVCPCFSLDSASWYLLTFFCFCIPCMMACVPEKRHRKADP